MISSVHGVSSAQHLLNTYLIIGLHTNFKAVQVYDCTNRDLYSPSLSSERLTSSKYSDTNLLLLHALWEDPGVWFSHKLHALTVELLLALFTLNHLSVIPFRESTYTVNMNEHNVMLPPTFLNRHLCGGKRCKLFIFQASFKVSSHFICILVLTERRFPF